MTTPLRLSGLVAAAHSPFKSNGDLNPDVVEAQARHLSSQNISKVFITGSTGESSSLQLEEKKELFHAWKEAGTRYNLLITAHVGSTCLEDGVELGQLAEQLGFAATSALAPSYYRPATIQDLVNCCAEIAAASPRTPFYYYDIPVLTNVRFSMVEFIKLAGSQIPNFAGIKFTNPDLAQYMKTLQSAGNKYDIPWGVDEWLVGALAAGAKGAVGSTYNFAPALYHKLIEAFKQGDMDTAREYQMKSIKLISILASHGYMGSAKALMNWLGVPLGPARLPLNTPDSLNLKTLRTELDNIGFFDWGND